MMPMNENTHISIKEIAERSGRPEDAIREMFREHGVGAVRMATGHQDPVDCIGRVDYEKLVLH